MKFLHKILRLGIPSGVLCLALIMPTSCDIDDSYGHMIRQVAGGAAIESAMSEGIGVTLEFAGYTSPTLRLIITNNSGYDVRYGDGYDISGKGWGYAGQMDWEYYDLPSGEQREICLSIYDLGPGELLLKKNIAIDPGNLATAKTYTLSVEFAVENATISPNVRSVKMSVDRAFSTAVGAVIDITNGFDSGRLYYDKYYWLQRRTNGDWQDMATIGSNNFPDDTNSLAPRQVLSLRIYWAWLYGELPAGEYRIGKSFLHCTDDGREEQYDLWAPFTLNGRPISDLVKKDGSDWRHPFVSISTFRAEVTELINPDNSPAWLGSTTGLLVSDLSVLRGDDYPYYVWDNFTVVVLDAGGEQIRFSDIPKGAIVEIMHGGLVLTSIPAHIAEVFLIKIIE